MRKRGRLNEFPLLGPEDVFDSKVDKSGECWLWLGGRNKYGYGIFFKPGEQRVRAHRYAYERVHGPIPAGLVVLHTCDNPACVNPAHLQVGTRDDNNKDSVLKKRNAFGIKNGHTILTAEQVSAIRADLRSQAEIARELGVNQSTVSRIRRFERRAKG